MWQLYAQRRTSRAQIEGILETTGGFSGYLNPQNMQTNSPFEGFGAILVTYFEGPGGLVVGPTRRGPLTILTVVKGLIT